MLGSHGALRCQQYPCLPPLVVEGETLEDPDRMVLAIAVTLPQRSHQKVEDE